MNEKLLGEIVLPQRSIAILGLGSSGDAAARLVQSLPNKKVFVLDSCEADKLSSNQKQTIDRLTQLGVIVLCGDSALNFDSTEIELVVISPGIDPIVPLVQKFIRQNIRIISEIELSTYFFKCPIIAITGTNGKTTTTGLVERMLLAAGKKTIAAGNIGKPLSEVALETTLTSDGELDLLTAEISSFQLERIETFHPQISVWLNLTADHLDRYPNIEAYKAAKLRIFENQISTDWAIIPFKADLLPLKAQTITFSAYEKGGDFYWDNGMIYFQNKPVLNQLAETQLKGRHNAENLMAAFAVGVACGLNTDQIKDGLATYSALPHRFELIRQLNQVEYINDSKATNIDALEKALRSITKDHSAILIAGGKNKNFDFESLLPLVQKKVRWAVLIGEIATQLATQWKPFVPCDCATDLKEAVQIAWSMAQPGNTVLLAPGTSSYDMFKDYADRGNQFRQLVHQLGSKN